PSEGGRNWRESTSYCWNTLPRAASCTTKRAFVSEGASRYETTLKFSNSSWKGTTDGSWRACLPDQKPKAASASRIIKSLLLSTTFAAETRCFTSVEPSWPFFLPKGTPCAGDAEVSRRWTALEGYRRARRRS